MASIASGRSSHTAKERTLVKLQAEVKHQEEVTKLATKRLALATLEADIISTKGSVRSSTMRSPDIKEPPTKMHKTRVQIVGNGGWEPPNDPDHDPDHNDEDDEDGTDSCPSTVHKPSPRQDPASPIIGAEEVMPTIPVELPILNAEALARHQLLPPETEEFRIHTPAASYIEPAPDAEKIYLAQQESLREQVAAEKYKLQQQEILLAQEAERIHREKESVVGDQERLIAMADKVQKQSEFNAMNNAMAEQRIKDEERTVDAEFRTAKEIIKNTELRMQERAEEVERKINLEDTTQRLRAIELQREYSEQKLQEENNARIMQQRLVELEHQSRSAAENLVNLSELKQRELILKEECAYKDSLKTLLEEERKRINAQAEAMIIQKENIMKLDFDEKYQSKFDVMQAELQNQFARLHAEKNIMKSKWDNCINDKDREIDSLKKELQEAIKALGQVNRPGSSNDIPVITTAATSTMTRVKTATIPEKNNPNPPSQPGGYGGGGDGGDGNDPRRPSGPGRASQPSGNNNNNPDPGNPGGPNDPNPPDDSSDTLSAVPESLIAAINTKGSKEAEKINLPNLPKAHAFRNWKLTVRKTILSASVDPDATWLWLLEIEKDTTTYDSLQIPGDYFRTLDTKLCVAVDNLVKDNDSLKNDIMIATETLAKAGKRIAGRQVLYMVYDSYKTSVANGTVFDVMDVIAVELHGNHMEHFLHRWDKVILGLAEPLPESTKKAFFVAKVKKCPAFETEYLNWKRKSDDDPTKTLETLRQAMKDLIEDARRDKVREEELRGLNGGGGSRRHHMPAYPAHQETTTTNTTSSTPNGGGGNRRRRGRSTNRNNRSASPGVRSDISDSKGKGKGKFDSRTKGCMYFNQGKGTCRLADKCAFSHDPKIAVYVPKGKGKGKRSSRSPSRSASPAGRDTPRGGRSTSPRSSSSRGSSSRPIDQTKYKTKPCDNYARGTCTFGDRCSFRHDD